MNSRGTLFVIGLPIGNLKDITLRALQTLKKLKYVVCEDTRTAKKLINHYNLGGKVLISYYKDVEKRKTEEVIKLLLSGEDVGLVSEAGTPLVSDPGSYLVKKCYELGIKVVPIPGVSAITCALSVSGIDLKNGFVFLGFLPKKFKDLEEVFENIPLRLPVVVFIPPHDAPEIFKNLLKILGNRSCFLARELTKIHEELRWTNLEELTKIEEFRGEITLVISPSETKDKKLVPSEEELKKEFELLCSEKIKPKEAIKLIAQRYGISTKWLYELLVKKR
ncbi:MAG: 16S rRNA (cytidine(1402)-2'-O)-methyltransferase [Thermodesulfobacteria bacterium]|nr:16S rRNA (cytidine(1402)-2'-O)-methyltransferase [Thermodesulfobacteriota bacterium]